MWHVILLLLDAFVQVKDKVVCFYTFYTEVVKGISDN